MGFAGEPLFEIGQFLKRTYRKTKFSGVGRSKFYLMRRRNSRLGLLMFALVPIGDKNSVGAKFWNLIFFFFFGADFFSRRLTALPANFFRSCHDVLKEQRLRFNLKHYTTWYMQNWTNTGSSKMHPQKKHLSWLGLLCGESGSCHSLYIYLPAQTEP